MTTSMLPPHIRDQIGALDQGGPTVRELHEQNCQSDLEELERQRQQLSHRRDDDYTPWRYGQQRTSRRRDYDPAPPRQFTAKDIADFEKAEEFQALQGNGTGGAKAGRAGAEH